MTSLKKLFTEEDAVSPVIGVILMVAITVILAAVIATFVLGLGDQVSDSSPQASFSFDYDSGGSGASLTLDGSSDSTTGNLTVTHSGGASIVERRLTANDDDGDGPVGLFGTSTSSEVSAGQTSVATVGSDDKVRVIWQNQDNTTSATLQEWEGPDA